MEDAARKDCVNTRKNCYQPMSRRMDHEVSRQRYNHENLSHNTHDTGQAYQRYMNEQKKEYTYYSSEGLFTSRKTSVPSKPSQNPQIYEDQKRSVSPSQMVHDTLCSTLFCFEDLFTGFLDRDDNCGDIGRLGKECRE